MSLERPTFMKTWARAGYTRPQVDAAVDRVLQGLAATPQITVQEIDSLAFACQMYRPGYDMAEVDNWLDRAAEEVGSPPRPPRPLTVTRQQKRRADLVGWIGIAVVAVVLVWLYVL